MSWTARREGILSLCDLAKPQVCSHPVFLRGFNMVIDGMDPEFVKSTMAQGRESLRCLYEAKRQHFRQLGALLLSVGIFGGLSAASVFVLRFWEGGAFSAEESISAMFLSCLFLMSGMTVFFMIPCRILGEYRREETLQRQITDGLIELQSGDSYSAVLLRQSLFLSKQERQALKDVPISEELKPYMRRNSYDQAVSDIRSVMANDAK
jgi:chemotaxis protein MotA